MFFFFKIAKKEEIARRLEGDLSSLQETIKSYAEEVKRAYHGFLWFSERNWHCSVCSQVAQLNGKLTATQTTLTTRDQELREKENEVEF